jgi:hypothetical protein
MAKDESGPKYNTGLKLHASEVGERLAFLEKRDPKISYGVLDPAAFAQNGGPSIAEEIYKGSGKTIIFRRADNARVGARGAMGGWDQMRSRLVGDDDGNPMIVTFSTCSDSIRTIPAMQHDLAKVEDIDTDGEDHAGDEWRYACMSRPWARQAPPSPQSITKKPTLNELLRKHDRGTAKTRARI